MLFNTIVDPEMYTNLILLISAVKSAMKVAKTPEESDSLMNQLTLLELQKESMSRKIEANSP